MEKRPFLVTRAGYCSSDFQSTGEPGLPPAKVPMLSIAWHQLWVFVVGVWAGGELLLAGTFKEVAGLQRGLFC